MAQFLNEKDYNPKVLRPAVTVSITNPVDNATVGGATYTVPTGYKTHVLGISVSGSAVGNFALCIDDIDVYTLRIAANGFIRETFYQRTFTATVGQVIKIVARENLTGIYEAHMEMWSEDQLA